MMKKITALTVILVILGFSLFSQTNPAPFSLSGGDFTFTEWASTSTTGTFPANMVFHYTNDPTSTSYDSTLNGNADYDCSYSTTSRCRFNGVGVDGVSIVATTSAQYDNCASGSGASTRFTGATVVALDATGRQNLSVTFTGGTVTAGDGVPPREFVIRLQYRYDNGSGFNTWQDVPGPVQVVSGTTGSSETVGPVSLPVELNNQANIQLRWLYFQTALNAGGTRPKMRLDDITVTSQPASSVYINTTAVSTSPFCLSATSSASGTVSYSAVGTFSSSNFSVKLSDASGDFSSAVEIGTLLVTGTDPNGDISVTIPAGTPGGTGYKVRVDSDNPVVTGFVSSAFTIYNGVEMATDLLTSACGANVDISWTNPLNCFEEVMIVMQEDLAFSTPPTGDGSSYNASNTYGTGSAFENGYIVYKGSSSPQTITGIQSNKHYYVAVFSRNGSNWSSSAITDFYTTVQPVTALTPTPGDGQADLAWTDPTYCFDEIMIVVKEGSAVTTAPSGDGSAYTADAAFGSGTSFDGGFVMYKGIVSPQTFTGFTNGLTYHASAFVRLGSDWSISDDTTFITVGSPQLASYILPKYMEGKVTTNDERLAFAFRASLINLMPNTTYRYYTRGVSSTDGATSGGAGGSIFPNLSGAFTRSSNPSFSTAGDYGEFVTSATGSYDGWFIMEPSGNARYTPGNYVFPRIFLNDGNNGTTIANRFTLSDSVKVLGFNTNSDSASGTGVVGITGFTPKNFVFYYDNTSASGRPLYGAHVEACGIDFLTTAVYVPFYETQVYNTSGNWGGIVPNTNANGIMAIQELSITDGSVLNTFTSSNSVWGPTNTIDPSGGATTPLVIDFFVSSRTIGSEVNGWYVFDNVLYLNENQEKTVINIFNVLGQNVFSATTSEKSINLNMAEGTYMLKIENGNKITTGKFVITE